ILTSTTMSPTVEGAFIVPDLQATIRPFDWASDMPNRGPGPNLVFLETEHDQALADEFARMYPDAVRRPVRPPAGGKPIVEGFQLEPDVLAAHRSILASYRGADGTAVERTEARPDTASNNPPVALPADVTWHGGLAIDATGEYSFRVPAGFELRLDDAPLPAAAGSGVRVRLPRGNHALLMTGRVDQGTRVGLEWQTPTAGTYGFSLDHSQNAAVFIDDQQVLGNLNAPSDVRNAIVTLSAGRHGIRAQYEKTSEGSPWIDLFWTPPGQPPAVVPGSA